MRFRKPRAHRTGGNRILSSATFNAVRSPVSGNTGCGRRPSALCYDDEEYPTVNWVDPDVVFGTSYTYIV
jgi:hypothetical protein